MHVVRLVRRRRHQRVERGVFAINRIVDVARAADRRGCCPARGQQLADQREALAVVVHGKVRDAAGLVVRHRAAELLLGDVLVRHRLDDVGAGHEHVARVLDHDDEVGDGRRVHGAAGARAHDRRDLRHDAARPACCEGRCRRSRRATRRLPECARRRESFRPTIGAPIFIARSMTLTIFCGVGFGERSAEDREVLREGEDEAAVNAARAR